MYIQGRQVNCTAEAHQNLTTTLMPVFRTGHGSSCGRKTHRQEGHQAKQLDRRGMVTWGQRRLLCTRTSYSSHSPRLSTSAKTANLTRVKILVRLFASWIRMSLLVRGQKV